MNNDTTGKFIKLNEFISEGNIQQREGSCSPV